VLKAGSFRTTSQAQMLDQAATIYAANFSADEIRNEMEGFLFVSQLDRS
jgi:hypothetical protein